MSDLTNADFMDPYEVAKYLQGVIEGRKFEKRTFLQDQFGDRSTFEQDTFNVDREKDQKNVMGQYVHPKADGGYIQLPDFGSQELRAAYSKEAIQTDDFESLNQRQLGQAFGQVDVLANDANNLNKKLANALAAFDNLKEKAAADIIFLGAHTASGPKASTVVWDFDRTVVTTDADYLIGYVPAVDLTTLDGNGGVGKRAWDSTGGTKAPTPYLDLKKMVETARARDKTINKFIMGSTALTALEDDIKTNYAFAADLTISVMQRIELKILPTIDTYKGATYQRTIMFGPVAVDIYTYTGAANNRQTGVEEQFMPAGYVAAIPDARYQLIRYGRIKHRKARWQAMPIWINTWDDKRSGEIEQELHTSFLLAPWDPDALISWKVAST